jgi:hypothetical protein
MNETARTAFTPEELKERAAAFDERFGSNALELLRRENQQHTPEQWTLQRFAEVAGQPWFALQQHGPDGVQRQYTGHAHEVAELAAQMRITPRVLPATTEEQFYSSLTKNVRDYELGRQFAADPERGIRQDLVPYDIDRYSAGQQVRTMEDKIRLENAAVVEAGPQHFQQLAHTPQREHAIESSRTPKEEQAQQLEQNAFGLGN